jgi:hypothetical protein
MMKRLFRDGVFSGYLNELEVVEHTPSADMYADVKTGGGWVQGHIYANDALKAMTIEASHATLDRTDRIVLRRTYDSPNSDIVLAVLKGSDAAAGTSTPTALTQDSTTWEISLAQVLVAAGATSIVTASITDERLTEYCGLSAGILGDMFIDTSGNLDGSSNRIVNLADPSENQDASTKKYVDDAVADVGNPDPSGNAGKVPRVKSDETGYELFTPSYFMTASASDTTRYTNSTIYQVVSPDDNVYKFSFSLPQNHNMGGTYRIVTELVDGYVTLKYGVNSSQIISDGSQDIVIPCGGGAVIDVILSRTGAATTTLSSFVIKCTETPTAPAW